MWLLCSNKYLIFVSPCKNHNNSLLIKPNATRFVVKSGNPFCKSKRIWYPNTLFVPVPVRSVLIVPSSKIFLSKSLYCFVISVPFFNSLLILLNIPNVRKPHLSLLPSYLIPLVILVVWQNLVHEHSFPLARILVSLRVLE